jgi:hypothetical protein
MNPDDSLPQTPYPARMKLLFVHQNFPGQYLNLAPRIARDGHTVVAISSRPDGKFDGIKIINYDAPKSGSDGSASLSAPRGSGRRPAASASPPQRFNLRNPASRRTSFARIRSRANPFISAMSGARRRGVCLAA